MLMGAEVLLGGLASLGGSLASQHMASVNSAEAFNRQKELMRLQNQYAVENWNRENAYNTPKAQKERLRAAGLNPDLMYGNGASGLVAGSIDSPSAPSAPMTPTMDFSKSVGDAVMAAQGIAAAKKSKSETVAQDIENKYLEDRCRNEIAQQLETLGFTADQRREINARIENISKSTAALQVEMDATRVRLGFEQTDRLISSFNAVVNAAAVKNKIDDDVATRSSRIFSLVARGHVDEANSYLLGLFKNPKKFKTFVSDWKDMLSELFHDATGKDSEGHSGVNPVNKNPNSPAAKASRSFFMALDDWISSFTGAPQPWKK